MATDYTNLIKKVWKKYTVGIILALAVTFLGALAGLALLPSTLAVAGVLYFYEAYQLNWQWSLGEDKATYLRIAIPSGVAFAFGLVLALFL